MAQRNRPAKTITLAADLMARLELEASVENLSVSQLIESHLQEYYHGGPSVKLDRMEATLNDFRASVLPVIAKVSAMLQQIDMDVPGVTGRIQAAVKIASAEEMYGAEYAENSHHRDKR